MRPGEAIGNFKKSIKEPDEIDVTPKKDSSKKEGTSEKEDEQESIAEFYLLLW